MDNIIIYTDMPLVSYEAALADIDEVNVRVVKGAELKDFATHNPSLIIIDEVASFKDVLMTNKLPIVYPLLPEWTLLIFLQIFPVRFRLLLPYNAVVQHHLHQR